MSAPAPRGGSKRGRASLIGGLATGAAVWALWIAVAARLSWGGAGAVVSGLVAAAAVAFWVRIADL